ncbi:MAG: hypothetical protein Q4B77_07280 [Coriobacteriaceae bacterium]|nr:hypothetical protein [Coriobacteriaceae bacterium]
MAPVMAAAVGIAALSLGLAALAIILLIVALVLSAREIKRVRAGGSVRTGIIAAATVLYILSLPYLGLFIWFWFFD